MVHLDLDHPDGGAARTCTSTACGSVSSSVVLLLRIIIGKIIAGRVARAGERLAGTGVVCARRYPCVLVDDQSGAISSRDVVASWCT